MTLTRRSRCFIPRGDTRLYAIGLAQAANRRGHDRSTLAAALWFAAQVHAGQRRSADDGPYIIHPLMAATLVCHWGGTSDDVVAAVLHDTAEDAADGPEATLAHIERHFGSPVAQRVAAVTKQRSCTDREHRAQDLLHRVRQASLQLGPGVAAIRLADRLHNCMTAAHFSPAAQAALQADSALHVAPLADDLGLHAVADFLRAGPAAWAEARRLPFLPAMLALQPAWLGQAQTVPPAMRALAA